MATDGLTTIPSSFGPRETTDRLEAEIKAKGMTVFARIDHAAGAAEFGLPLRPSELLIFGSAKAGTPLMQANQAGIDLPLKALVFEDAAGKVWLSYNDPRWLAQRTGSARPTSRPSMRWPPRSTPLQQKQRKHPNRSRPAASLAQDLLLLDAASMRRVARGPFVAKTTSGSAGAMESLHRSREMCEWDEFAQETECLRAVLAEGLAVRLSPFQFLTVPGVSAREQRDCSELWTKDRRARSVAIRDDLAFRFDREAPGKIRIGYLSNDFHDHATLLLLIEMFEAHDRAHFEVHGFSFGADDGKAMRRRLRDAFHTVHDVSTMSDVAAACAIHAAEIDILVDLKGFTQGARHPDAASSAHSSELSWLSRNLGRRHLRLYHHRLLYDTDGGRLRLFGSLRLHAAFLSAARTGGRDWPQALTIGCRLAGQWLRVLLFRSN
jgi:uncharacterized protein (DUF302 family)